MLTKLIQKTLNTNIFKNALKQNQALIPLIHMHNFTSLRETLPLQEIKNNNHLQNAYFWPIWPNNAIEIMKKEIILNNNQNFIIRNIEPVEIKKCIELQNKLTDQEKGAFSVRTIEEYEKIAQEGILLGAFNDKKELIGQIATDLDPVKKDYIHSDNKKIQKILENSNYIEQGAVIVDRKYRGHSLQNKLLAMLIKKVEMLINDKKELERKNKYLSLKIQENKSLFVVGGCNAENYSSGINMMKSGLHLVGKVSKTLNHGTKDEVTVNGCIFAKKILSDENIVYDNSEKTKNKICNLLELREKLQEESEKNGSKEPYHLDFVKKFTDDGFIMSLVKMNQKYYYKLSLPI